MYCRNRITHTVQEGDSLYKLSRQYDTSVTDLILGNPGANPYNLQVGMKLTICPGEDYNGRGDRDDWDDRDGRNDRDGRDDWDDRDDRDGRDGWDDRNEWDDRDNWEERDNRNMRAVLSSGMVSVNENGMAAPTGQNSNRPQMPPNQNGNQNNNRPQMPPNQNNNRPVVILPQPDRNENEIENAVENLREDMRLAWLNLIFWNRMYLMSIVADSADQDAVEERAMETADEITDVFARYLPLNATRQLRGLLADHVDLTGELIRILKSGNRDNYDAALREWYGNANQLASLLGVQNPFFGSRETRNLLLNHLDLVREEIEQQVNGDYAQSIETFRDLQKQTLDMADYFSRGLLAR